MAMSLGDVKTPQCGLVSKFITEIHIKNCLKSYSIQKYVEDFFLYDIFSDNRLLNGGTSFAYKDYNMCNLENNFSYYLAYFGDIMSLKKKKISIKKR